MHTLFSRYFVTTPEPGARLVSIQGRNFDVFVKLVIDVFVKLVIAAITTLPCSRSTVCPWKENLTTLFQLIIIEMSNCDEKSLRERDICK